MFSFKNSLLFLCFILVLPGLASAQTADFLTPSVETVCDDLQGAAFGLCNAYCEAMDCHLENPQASLNACAKVLNRFQTVTGGNPPCESTCPCTNNGEFDQLINGELTILACGLTATGGINVVGINLLAATDVGPPLQCGIFSENSDLVVEINQEQFDSCTALLLEASNAQGLSCEGGPTPF